MKSGEPSRTALAAARHRAAHQLLEHGSIFADPLAVRILGDEASNISQEAEHNPSGRRMRIFIAVRTRFAEDALAAAVERGVRQLVVLGAGLDAAGFDPAQQTFFTWLGVVPYLTEEAVWSTLGLIASLPNGAHVVFDYSDPPDSLPPEIAARYFLNRVASIPEKGGHILRAATI